MLDYYTDKFNDAIINVFLEGGGRIILIQGNCKEECGPNCCDSGYGFHTFFTSLIVGSVYRIACWLHGVG